MKKQLDIFGDLPLPRNNEQEVLATLILQGHVSLFDFPVMAGFRTRVSQLQSIHKIQLDRKMDSRFNKFGNQYTYAIHFLPKTELDFAKKVYLNMVNKNN